MVTTSSFTGKPTPLIVLSTNSLFMHYRHLAGFEGEGELSFTTQDSQESIEMWAGFFGSIIREIHPNKDGMWESLALIYHVRLGWYSVSPFELSVENTRESLKQLESLAASDWNSRPYDIYNDLLKVFRYAVDNNMTIFADYC